MRHLVVFLPGFGEDRIAHKLEILCDNVATIVSTCAPFSPRITVIVRLYSMAWEGVLQTWIEHVLFPTFPTVSFSVQAIPGLLGEFLVQHPWWKLFPSASHWLWILDDVRLGPSCVNVAEMAHVMSMHRLDVLSPTMTVGEGFCHKFMRSWDVKQPRRRLRLTNFAELFCFLLTADGCQRLWQLIPRDSRFLWGVDMLLAPYGKFRIGLLEGAEMIHFYTSKEGDKTTYRNMCRELREVKRRFPDNVNFRFREHGCVDV